MKRWEGRDYLFVAALIALLLLTRLPLLTDYLYEWDSIQFALGLERFDVPLHHPHPPGYPFYMLAARAVNGLLHDANTSLCVLSLIFSCLTLMTLYALGREMGGRGAAMVASIVLFCAPVFWLYGEVSTIYAAEGMWSVLIAFSCYRSSRGRASWLFISAALLGIAGGFRGNIVLFLFPLWLFCALKGCRHPWRIILALLILALSTLSWYLPLLILFGRNYLIASRLLYSHSNVGSIFVDPAGDWISNAGKIVLNTLFGFGPGCWIVLLYFLAASRRRRLAEFSWPFFFWWVLPAFFYYLFLHIKKPGYTLTYIPALALLLGCLLGRRNSQRRFPAPLLALAAALAWNIFILFPPEGKGFGMVISTGRKRFSLWRLNDRGGAMKAFQLLRERADQRTAILSGYSVYTRFASYYLPEFYVYHSDFIRIDPLVVYHDRRVVGRGEEGTISLLPEIKEIAVIGRPPELKPRGGAMDKLCTWRFFRGAVEQFGEVTFDDPGLTSEEITCDPRYPHVTIFRISPRFREVVYDHLTQGREVRIRRGGAP